MDMHRKQIRKQIVRRGIKPRKPTCLEVSEQSWQKGRRFHLPRAPVHHNLSNMKRSRKAMRWDPSDVSQLRYPQELLNSAAANVPGPPRKVQRQHPRPRKATTNKKGSTLRKRQALESVPEDNELPVAPDTVIESHNAIEHSNDDHAAEPSSGDYELDDQTSATYEDDNLTPVSLTDAPSKDQELDRFIDSVANGVAGFKHVHSNFCVVQGWDSVRHRSQVSGPFLLLFITTFLSNQCRHSGFVEPSAVSVD